MAGMCHHTWPNAILLGQRTASWPLVAALPQLCEETSIDALALWALSPDFCGLVVPSTECCALQAGAHSGSHSIGRGRQGPHCPSASPGPLCRGRGPLTRTDLNLLPSAGVCHCPQHRPQTWCHQCHHHPMGTWRRRCRPLPADQPRICMFFTLFLDSSAVFT